VIIIRERNGASVPAVFKSEDQALNFIRSRIEPGTIVNADEAPAWNNLHARFEMKRINHDQAYSVDGACTHTLNSPQPKTEICSYIDQHIVPLSYATGESPSSPGCPLRPADKERRGH
jgi:hypothetical protein